MIAKFNNLGLNYYMMIYQILFFNDFQFLPTLIQKIAFSLKDIFSQTIFLLIFNRPNSIKKITQVQDLFLYFHDYVSVI